MKNVHFPFVRPSTFDAIATRAHGRVLAVFFGLAVLVTSSTAAAFDWKGRPGSSNIEDRRDENHLGYSGNGDRYYTKQGTTYVQRAGRLGNTDIVLYDDAVRVDAKDVPKGLKKEEPASKAFHRPATRERIERELRELEAAEQRDRENAKKGSPLDKGLTEYAERVRAEARRDRDRQGPGNNGAATGNNRDRQGFVSPSSSDRDRQGTSNGPSAGPRTETRSTSEQPRANSEQPRAGGPSGGRADRDQQGGGSSGRGGSGTGGGRADRDQQGGGGASSGRPGASGARPADRDRQGGGGASSGRPGASGAGRAQQGGASSGRAGASGAGPADRDRQGGGGSAGRASGGAGGRSGGGGGADSGRASGGSDNGRR